MKNSTKWFYPFVFNNGDKVDCWLSPNILPLHDTRKKALNYFLKNRVLTFDTALDVACHQGFFSFELEKYFNTVLGIDKNEQSISEAIYVSEKMGLGKCQFLHCNIEDYVGTFDLVLCFGVLYHTENPISFLRKISQLTNRYLIIETQIISSFTPHLEDGTYKNIKEVKGTFGLTIDDSEEELAGITDLAMVPDLNALLYMLKYLKFQNIELYKPEKGDYEQFTRNQRIIVFAEK